MRALHLHIGRHKSGTSSLQHIFSSKKEFLKENNFYYPTTGRDSIVAHHKLAIAFNQRFFQKSRDADLLVEKLEHELQSCHCENILISSEAFQNITRLNNLKSLFRLFDKVVCYVYFREPLDYLQSSYRQKIQNSNYSKSFNEYANESRFDYTKFLNNWLKISDDVIIRFFHQDFLLEKDIIADFFSLLNIDTSNLPRDLNLNPSIGGNLLYYKILVNLNELHSNRLYNGLMEIAATEKRYREKFFISNEESKHIRECHKHNLEFLEEHFGAFNVIDFSNENPYPDLKNLISDLDTFKNNKKVKSSIRELYLK